MHRYLKSIGFGSITKKKQLKEVFDQILAQPDSFQLVQTGEDSNLCVLTRDFGPDMGIALCGEFNDEDEFELEYYYPYFYGDVVSTTAPCQFKRQGEKESYAGSCDDYRIGITLIFYLSNFMDMQEIYSNTGSLPEAEMICLSGLAEEGKILFPVYHTSEQKAAAQLAAQKRSEMIQAAKTGDKSAIEYLTQDEMRTFTHLNRQIDSNDIYTLIDSFFMPDGVECDQYAVMGEIEDVNPVANTLTGETVYQLLVNCNDIYIQIAIHQDDLLGIPENGRRFKGRIWLQGHADFAY